MTKPKDSTFNVPIAPAPKVASSRNAENEAIAMAKGLNLNDKKTANKLNQLGRTDQLEGHLHIAIVLAIYFIGALLAAAILILFLHMTSLKVWMTPEDVDRLSDFLFTGSVGAGLASLTTSRLKKERDDQV